MSAARPRIRVLFENRRHPLLRSYEAFGRTASARLDLAVVTETAGVEEAEVVLLPDWRGGRPASVPPGARLVVDVGDRGGDRGRSAAELLDLVDETLPPGVLLVSPMRRDRELLAPWRVVEHLPGGYDASMFRTRAARADAPKIGWCADLSAACGDADAALELAARVEEDVRIADPGLHARGIVDFLAEIDVFALASADAVQESLMLEAAGAGAVIVAVDAGLARELVTPGEDGFLVDADPAAFQAAFFRCRRELPRLLEGAARRAARLARERSFEALLPLWERRVAGWLGRPVDEARRLERIALAARRLVDGAGGGEDLLGTFDRSARPVRDLDDLVSRDGLAIVVDPRPGERRRLARALSERGGDALVIATDEIRPELETVERALLDAGGSVVDYEEIDDADRLYLLRFGERGSRS